MVEKSLTEHDAYLQERESIRADHGHKKVKRIRRALKVAALILDKQFTLGECMDEYGCSYTSALRAYQEIEDDPAYRVEKRLFPEWGLPKYIISRVDTDTQMSAPPNDHTLSKS